jgi:hypothetical protein
LSERRGNLLIVLVLVVVIVLGRLVLKKSNTKDDDEGRAKHGAKHTLPPGGAGPCISVVLVQTRFDYCYFLFAKFPIIESCFKASA